MKTIPQTVNRRDEWNEIQSHLIGFFRANERKLAQLAFEKGATEEEIAKRLGVSQTAVKKNYPKEVQSVQS